GEGFPWYLLSHTQHDFLTLIQISDLTGAYGVTFLLVAVNAVVAAVLFRTLGIRQLAAAKPEQQAESIFGLVAQVAVVGLLFAGTLLYGNYRLDQAPFTKGPRLALVQCNLEQDILNAENDSTVIEQRQHYTQ